MKTTDTSKRTPRPWGFTLIELMVVIAIIVILATISVPAIKSLTKGNAQAQALNMIRAELGSARSIAISQHRRAGVVFLNETKQFSSPVNANQTAMQIFVEDYNQTPYYAAGQNASTLGFTNYSSERQYLPSGIRVATLSTTSTGGTDVNTGDNTSSQKVRAILFNGDGQVVIRNYIATLPSTGAPGTYPMAFGDWHFSIPDNQNNVLLDATSSAAFMVFDQNGYAQQTTDTTRSAWIQQNADVIVLNPYTGNPIQ